MTDYHIYALHSGGLTLSSHVLRSETDEQAKAYCKHYLPDGGMAEIWKNEKCIDVVWLALAPVGQTKGSFSN